MPFYLYLYTFFNSKHYTNLIYLGNWYAQKFNWTVLLNVYDSLFFKVRKKVAKY